MSLSAPFLLLVSLPSLLALAALAVFLKIFIGYFPLWVESTAAGLKVGPLQMVMMHLRRNPVAELVEAYKVLTKAGVPATLEQLEAHCMSGGDLQRVAGAAVAADKAGLRLDFRTIAAVDLAGRDVREAVESHVNPKVLLCPAAPGGEGLTSIAQDGVKLGVRARITVRTRLERMVGGAGEETVVARIGQGIVAAVGRARSHRQILENPQLITRNILARGLDTGTCFEILSVDIASVDVLGNAAAALQCARAAAEKRIARARAEERRSAAVATCQEMRAKTMAMQVRVTSARRGLPLAVGGALARGSWGGAGPVADLMLPRFG